MSRSPATIAMSSATSGGSSASSARARSVAAVMMWTEWQRSRSDHSIGDAVIVDLLVQHVAHAPLRARHELSEDLLARLGARQNLHDAPRIHDRDAVRER